MNLMKLPGAAVPLLTSLLASSAAWAMQPGKEAHLFAVSPTIDPATNFPLWYEDSQGQSLQLCTTNNDILHLCLFAPIEPDAPNLAYQQQIGFGDEAFWWLGQADLTINASADCPTCGRAVIVLAVEAAYNSGPAVRGDEFVFGRVRMRIDTPYAGRYKVAYPFGEETFDVDAAGLKGINSTSDIGTSGPDFTGPLKSQIGNFLIWDPAVPPAAPAGYIGDSTVTHSVIGATHLIETTSVDPVSGATVVDFVPFNKVRIEYVDGPTPIDQVNLDGAGHPFVETDQFTLQGLYFNGQFPTPLTVPRATYSNGNIEVVAEAPTNANVNVTFGSDATTEWLGGSNGTFALVESKSPVPDVARVTAQAEGNTPTTINALFKDVVTIATADYDLGSHTLRVSASSSNAAAEPKLTVWGIGPLDAMGQGEFKIASVPAEIEVRSSAGGLKRAETRLIGTVGPVVPPPPPSVGGTGGGPTDNLPPVAVNDAATTVVQTSVVVSVADNDSDPEGALNPGSIEITKMPEHGTIGLIGPARVTYVPAEGFSSGTDSFEYTIADNLGARSNKAIVTVTIEPEVIGVDLNQFVRSKAQWRVRGTTNAIADNTITAYLVQRGVKKKIGSAAVDALGAFDIRNNNGAALVPLAGDTVRLESAKGTVRANVTITLK